MGIAEIGPVPKRNYSYAYFEYLFLFYGKMNNKIVLAFAIVVGVFVDCRSLERQNEDAGMREAIQELVRSKEAFDDVVKQASEQLETVDRTKLRKAIQALIRRLDGNGENQALIDYLAGRLNGNDVVKQASEQLETVNGTKLREAIQELIDYQAGRKDDTNEKQIDRRRGNPTKPEILVSGICSRTKRPCCQRAEDVWQMKQLAPIPDLQYPDCRPDGFYVAKQCHFLAGCRCVDKNGKSVPPKERSGRHDVECYEDGTVRSGDAEKDTKAL